MGIKKSKMQADNNQNTTGNNNDNDDSENSSENASNKPANISNIDESNTPLTNEQKQTVTPIYSKILTLWLQQVKERMSESMHTTMEYDALNYFELNCDVTEHIFWYLQPLELCRMACVNKYYRELADSNDYWKYYYQQKTKICKIPRTALGCWKHMCKDSQEFASLSECMSKMTSGTTITIPSGIHTHRIELSDHSYPNIDDIWIVGVSNIKEEPVIFTTREPASLLLTSLQNVLVRNIRFHHKLDSPIQTYRSAIFVKGHLILEDCEITSSSALVYGIYLFEKATALIRNCHIHDCQTSAVLAWNNASVVIEDSKIYQSGSIVVRKGATLKAKNCVMYNQLQKVGANAIYAVFESTVVLDQCKIYGNSNQGVQTEGKMEICNSELYDHKFSAIRILKTSDVIVKNCKIKNCATGLLISDGAKAQVLNTEIKLCTTAVEVEDGSFASAFDCMFSENNCGVAAHGSNTVVEMSGCKMLKNNCGIKIGVEAKGLVQRNEIRNSEKYGLHICKFEDDTDAALVQSLMDNNDISISKEKNIYLESIPNVVRTAQTEKIATEVLIAIKQKICTYQLTGKHYRIQRVWRCESCNLTGNRGVCEVCKETCHAGHELTLESEAMSFFCDCGAEKFCETFAANKRNIKIGEMGQIM